MNPEIGLVPVPLVLDLYSLGHSAKDVAEKLGLPNGRHVARIVAHARSIADPRAVYHVDRTGRLLGKGIAPAERKIGRRQKEFRGFLIVPVISLTRPACRNGHQRPSGTPCRVCQNEGRIRRNAARRGRQALRQALQKLRTEAIMERTTW